MDSNSWNPLSTLLLLVLFTSVSAGSHAAPSCDVTTFCAALFIRIQSLSGNDALAWTLEAGVPIETPQRVKVRISPIDCACHYTAAPCYMEARLRGPCSCANPGAWKCSRWEKSRQLFHNTLTHSVENTLEIPQEAFLKSTVCAAFARTPWHVAYSCLLSITMSFFVVVVIVVKPESKLKLKYDLLPSPAYQARALDQMNWQRYGSGPRAVQRCSPLLHRGRFKHRASSACNQEIIFVFLWFKSHEKREVSGMVNYPQSILNLNPEIST